MWSGAGRGLVFFAVAILTSLLFTKNTDFRVYSYGVAGFFSGFVCPYGPTSGLGFPMHYRYPPVTYLLLWPLGQVSTEVGGGLWMMGAWTVIWGTVRLAVRRAQLQFTREAMIAGGALMLAYAVLTVRSGNVQPYIVALIWSAMCLSEHRRGMAASLLSLAISFKIWPVFFLPWFLRRERRATLVYLLPALVILWLSPLLFWSASTYWRLLLEWDRYEFETVVAQSEIWYFPGQSLRGVLLRYFTPLEPWISGFPDVHVMACAPATVVRLWAAVAGASYLAVCMAMLRSSIEKRWIWDGISFALFSLLQPFALKSSLISLGPAALIAAAAYSRESARTLAGKLFLGAASLSFIAAILQYRPALALLLAWGVDFYVAVQLLLALILWALVPETEARPPSDRRAIEAPSREGAEHR